MKKTTKSQNVSAVPEGYHTVTPFLVVDNADELIDFIKKAFHGEVESVYRQDDNKIVNANVKIGDSAIMIADAMGEMEPELAMLYLYVDDVDAVYQSALDANGESLREIRDEFYGDRAGAVKDRWGNKWWIATHKEDIDEKELARRSKEAARKREAQPTH